MLWCLSKTESDEIFSSYRQNNVYNILIVNLKGIGYSATKYVRIRNNLTQ